MGEANVGETLRGVLKRNFARFMPAKDGENQREWRQCAKGNSTAVYGE